MLKRFWPILILVFILHGCEATQLYIVHKTVIGIDAAVNNEQRSGHLVIGYDRRFLAISPKSVEVAETKEEPNKAQNDSKPRDTMSVLSCSHTEVDGLFLTKFVERLATGATAYKFATKTVGGDIFDCSKDTK